MPIIISGLFAIVFLPLFVPSSFFFPYITGKAFAFRFIIEIVTACWLILAIQGSKYRPNRSSILASIGAFVGILIIATIFSENPYRSFWSNFERMEGLISHLHLFFYFLVMVSVLKTEEIWQRFFLSNVMASVLVGLYGLLQLAGKLPIMQGGVRLDSTLGNAAYLGTYMFLMFFITGYLLSKNWQNINWRYFYLGAMALQVIILYQTATRGAILGFIFSSGILAVIMAWSKRDNKLVRNWAIGTLVFLGLVTSAVWLGKDTTFVAHNPVLSRFASISLADPTVKARFLIWGIAWQGVKERPLLGWGQDSFPFVFNKYYNPEMYAQEPWFDRSHNVFLDWLVAGGLFGLLAYLAIFFSCLFVLIKNSKQVFTKTEQALLGALLAGYFVQNLVIFDNLTSYLLFFAILAYIHVRASGEPKAEKINTNRGVNAKYVPLVAVIIVLSFSAINFFVVVRPVMASSSLIYALQAASRNEIKTAAENFDQVFQYKTFADREASEQATSALTSAILSKNTDNENLSRLSLIAENGIKAQLASAPNDVRMMIFYADLLQLTNRSKESVAQLEKALEISPNKQDIYYRLAFFLADNGDMDKALSYAKKSYDILPANDRALKLYGLMALQSGDYGLAQKLLVPRFGTMAVDDNNFINYYSKIKRYDLIAEIWGERVQKNPNDTNAWVKYALATYALGNKAKSLQLLDQAVVANPAFKAEADKISNLIKEGRAVIE